MKKETNLQNEICLQIVKVEEKNKAEVSLLPYCHPYCLPKWLSLPKKVLASILLESSSQEKEQKQEKEAQTSVEHTLIEEKSRIQWAPHKGANTFPFISRNRYELIQLIGQGGMGSVYKALDKQTQRIVALKRILFVENDSQAALERFYREAKTIATLNHPYIVPLFDLGRDERGPFLTMQYVEGMNLKEKIKQDGPMPAEEAIPLMIKIGQALFYAHRYGVIHRDVKPENIMIGGGGLPRILDFGLARIGQKSDLTVTGGFMGTQFYASPEQLENPEIIDHRTDIYSFGATFYFILTGESPRVLRPTRVPKHIEPILFQCVEEKRENRYFSMDRVVEDLEALIKPLGKSKEEKDGPFFIPEKPRPKIIKGLCECGHINEEGIQYCENCGKYLFQECPGCKKKVSINIKNCGFCGVHIELRRKTLTVFHEAKKWKEEGDLAKAAELAKQALDLEELPAITQFLRHVHHIEYRFRKHIRQGDRAMEGEDYQRAIQEYQQALRLLPNHKEPILKIEESRKKLYSYHIRKAWDALDEGDLIEAKKSCFEAKKINPSEEIEEILSLVEERIREEKEKKCEEMRAKKNGVGPLESNHKEEKAISLEIDEDSSLEEFVPPIEEVIPKHEDIDDDEELRLFIEYLKEEEEEKAFESEIAKEFVKLAHVYEERKKSKALKKAKEERIHSWLTRVVYRILLLFFLIGIGFVIAGVISLVIFYFQ